MGKGLTQRLRDPLHDLIEFRVSGRGSALETALWNVLKTRPFQRLRRIKQLGFSDMVYPGATHSRFAHSVGTFHVARQLMQIIKEDDRNPDEDKENQALAAALLHDLGHGPFSHAFEASCKRLESELKTPFLMSDHEDVTEQLIKSDEIRAVFKSGFGSDFAEEVAKVVSKRGATTVHNAIVSSQFDADRLDYLRRDRLMTGVQHSALDFNWLMANLKLGEDQDLGFGADEAPQRARGRKTFGLSEKAIQTAEGYLLSYSHLYQTVYFRKATRGAECLFTELIFRLVTLTRRQGNRPTGLPASHPLIRFAKKPNELDNILDLDDTVVWGALPMMRMAADPLISEFSGRLQNRKLFKCCDIGKQVEERFSKEVDSTERFTDEFYYEVDRRVLIILEELYKCREASPGLETRILIDSYSKPVYKDGSKDRLEKILIFGKNGSVHDLHVCSPMVNSLREVSFSRVYVDSENSLAIGEVNRVLEKFECPPMRIA